MKSNKPETQPKCSEQRVLDELFINTIPGPAHEQELQEKSKTMCLRIIVAFSTHVRTLGGGEGWWGGVQCITPGLCFFIFSGDQLTHTNSLFRPESIHSGLVS